MKARKRRSVLAVIVCLAAITAECRRGDRASVTTGQPAERATEGGVKTVVSWDRLQEEGEALKSRSALAKTFLTLKELLSSSPRPSAEQICDVAQPAAPLRTAFSAWWPRREREAEARVLEKDLDTAVRQFADGGDLPLLVALQNLHAWMSFEMYGSMREVVPDIVRKSPNSSRAEIIGFLLVALEHPGYPDVWESLADAVAIPRDPRALPTLTELFFTYRGQRVMTHLVQAIATIDPDRAVLAEYFERVAGRATGGFVPAGTASARELRDQLSTLAPSR